MKKIWHEKFLLEKRSRGNSTLNEEDGRTNFDNDYSRIVNSSAMRRLQDKAQVFPLKHGDFVRSRLTHSIEVSHFGHTMGLSISKALCKNEILNFQHDYGKISGILATAGLVHDLGNPPFGHFGENIIKRFFEEYFKKMGYNEKKYKSNEYFYFDLEKKMISPCKISKKNKELIKNGIIDGKHILTKDEIKDLCSYDGNAQTFRILTKLQYIKDENGFNLTFPTLATIVKYPRVSCHNLKDVKRNKFGYFLTEKNTYEKIKSDLNLSGRHPITYLLEAADDIAYSVADIEDGVKKKIFNLDFIEKTFEKEEQNIFKNIKDDNKVKEINNIFQNYEDKLKEKGYFECIKNIKEEVMELIKDDEIKAWFLVKEGILLLKYYKINSDYKDIEELKVQELRIFLQTNMLIETQHCFINELEKICNFELKEKNILEDISTAKYLRKITKEIAKKIFSYKEITEAEILGHKILNTILEEMVNCVISENRTNENTYEGKVFNLISYNYRFLNLELSPYKKKNIKNPHVYDRLRTVIDFVSGMTDSYALEIYKKLTFM
ncbi:dGTP triphosphohydrolase [Fusobacterium varium]|uniref:dGTP triphosphohydrolase n=1 Tax=Fusobacterium varium TaxID=856 RepID=UPI00242ECD71|nr:dNTP triphosphohydrolase [Fusobacterium varium]